MCEGAGFAQELARRKLSVVLISRTADKLKAAEEAIKAKNPVGTHNPGACWAPLCWLTTEWRSVLFLRGWGHAQTANVKVITLDFSTADDAAYKKVADQLAELPIGILVRGHAQWQRSRADALAALASEARPSALSARDVLSSLLLRALVPFHQPRARP